MKKTKAFFITGTDTGVGKTVVAGLFARYLSEKGYRAITQKWVQTGSKGFSEDLDTHLRLMKKKREDIASYLPSAVAYNFKFACSPHLASRLEKRKISPARIKRSFESLSNAFDFVIIEGVGGLLVPITRKRLLIDIAKELNLPVLIVAQNKLGAINHTLLTIEALRARQMSLLGIVFNSAQKKENQIILKDNPGIIRALTGENIFGSLPWMKEQESLYKAFIPMGNKIFSRLAGES